MMSTPCERADLSTSFIRGAIWVTRVAALGQVWVSHISQTTMAVSLGCQSWAFVTACQRPDCGTVSCRARRFSLRGSAEALADRKVRKRLTRSENCDRMEDLR